MTSFVGGFDVEEDEIFLLKLLDGSIGLAFVVGVPQSCRTGYGHLVEAAIDTNAENEVDGRNDCSSTDTFGEEAHKRLHLRAIS